jgi:hypothetical protein
MHKLHERPIKPIHLLPQQLGIPYPAQHLHLPQDAHSLNLASEIAQRDMNWC